jgi:hypothetical protein
VVKAKKKLSAETHEANVKKTGSKKKRFLKQMLRKIEMVLDAIVLAIKI